MSPPLIEARNVSVTFGDKPGLLRGRSGPLVHAVQDVSLHLNPGETLALVGESGSGKTTLGRSLLMIPPPSRGEIRFQGNIVQPGESGLKAFRRDAQMIFQDPFGSLNPRMPISAIIAEPLIVHDIGNAAERRDRVVDLLEQVGLGPRDLDRYPHHFSGGQRQRIAIARALALNPKIIIADEPVSALDVSIQSQVLNLMADLADARGLAYLFISHDLAVVRLIADRVAVMYLGRIVEEAPAQALYDTPRHPYTQALLAAAPTLGGKRRRKLVPISGFDDPAPASGCPFRPRCPRATEACAAELPRLEPVKGFADHRAACLHPEETEATR